LKQFLPLTLLSLAILPSSVLGQTTTGTFCNAGTHPDGYIDLSLVPPAPAAVVGQVSGPFTYTLPVTGVSGLTVQITIPAGPPSQKAYTISQGALVPTITAGNANATIGLVFNKPVYAVSAIGMAPGRQSGFSIASSSPATQTVDPVSFDNSVGTFNLAIQTYEQPLQEVNLTSTAGGFTTTYITAGATDFGGPSFSNFRVQSISTVGKSLVPQNGLQQWLTSDTIGSPLAPHTTWPDSSGNGHDATQNTSGNQPGAVIDGLYCKPAYSFANNGYFNFNLPIDGWQQMTIFLVGKSAVNAPGTQYASEGAGIFWVENANWGNTFVSPYQTLETFRFGTKQVNNQPIYTRPTTVGQDFTITRAVHNNATDSLYVNGLLALSQGSKTPVLAGTSGAGFIGLGLNNTSYNGEISEILVYNRVLTADESAAVESYLRNKFGTQ
jgi:Concanavalin A-like lectin/glucanases superfamily